MWNIYLGITPEMISKLDCCAFGLSYHSFINCLLLLYNLKFTGCGTQNENDGHTRLMGRSFEVTKML
jgi:hypothetical protein